MKIQSECIPCLIKRIIFESHLSTADQSLHTKVIKNVCNAFADKYDPSLCSADLATQLHRIAYDTLHDSDPYKQLKEQSNKVAKTLVPKAKQLIDASNDPLKISMICAIVGNMLDFGIEGGSSKPEDLTATFEKFVKRGLGYDDYPTLHTILNNAKQILFFTDNCGEIVFDRLLLIELKKAFPMLQITLVVKGAPVLSDATLEDAHQLQMKSIVDEVETTGGFAVGVNFSLLSSTLQKKLDTVDLIICKGMANYESFSETSYRPIAYLMRIKCTAIARSSQLPINTSVIKVFEKIRK